MKYNVCKRVKNSTYYLEHTQKMSIIVVIVMVTARGINRSKQLRKGIL